MTGSFRIQVCYNYNVMNIKLLPTYGDCVGSSVGESVGEREGLREGLKVLCIMEDEC